MAAHLVMAIVNVTINYFLACPEKKRPEGQHTDFMDELADSFFDSHMILQIDTLHQGTQTVGSPNSRGGNIDDINVDCHPIVSHAELEGNSQDVK